MNLEKMTVMGVIITVVFTVTLSEDLQIVGGFSVSNEPLVFELYPGETQLLTWTLINEKNTTLNVEIFAEGVGSELFIFEQDIVIEPNSVKEAEVFVIVPEDHPDNVEYHPNLFAKEITIHEATVEGAKINFNIQMLVKPIIKIGDNPIFSPVVIEKSVEELEEEILIDTPKVEDLEITPTETLEEKLQRIKDTNKESATPETLPIDSPVIEKTVSLTPESEYVPEPIVEPIVKNKPLAGIIKECNFLEVILSWFGMGKC